MQEVALVVMNQGLLMLCLCCIEHEAPCVLQTTGQNLVC